MPQLGHEDICCTYTCMHAPLKMFFLLLLLLLLLFCFTVSSTEGLTATRAAAFELS